MTVSSLRTIAECDPWSGEADDVSFFTLRQWITVNHIPIWYYSGLFEIHEEPVGLD
jgi:hypothetical protein